MRSGSMHLADMQCQLLLLLLVGSGARFAVLFAATCIQPRAWTVVVVALTGALGDCLPLLSEVRGGEMTRVTPCWY